MHLTVKILNGQAPQECTLAASPCSLVSDLKEQVEALLSIPVIDQKLVFKGKLLNDTKPLRDYGVEDCAKIMLMLQKPSVKTPVITNNQQKTDKNVASGDLSKPAWHKLRAFLCRHFKEKDADAVLLEFQKEFEKNLSSLSLDDIERFAMTKLRQA